MASVQPASQPIEDTSGPWGISAADAAEVQGLVISPFEHLDHGLAIFLKLGEGRGGAWLQALLDDNIITAATGKTVPCGAVALTWSGLHRMGLPAAALATFAAPFREGMTEVSRQRRLGDDSPDLLWNGAMRWSGNVAPLQLALTPLSAPEQQADDSATPQVETEITVHALILLYDGHPDRLAATSQRVLGLMAPHGATQVFALPLALKPFGHGTQTPREHFGFADGFSQPLPQAIETLRDKLHGVSVGEVLMGHANAHGEKAPAPTVPMTSNARGLLCHSARAMDEASLGQNGTYLVVRQLQQDVACFRDSMAAAAATFGDPSITAEWFAEKVIGRQRDGDLLLPGAALPSVAGAPDNDFGFFAKDREGRGCPIGSHIRRANPRDGLARNEASRDSMRSAANNHRILRRGRKYGEPLPEGAPDDGAERGLLFMSLQTDIARQFEFIQQTWLFNPVFGTLAKETDPLMGPAGLFTIPGQPMRHVTHVDTFVRLVGGEYFFLPALNALRYLASPQ